MRLLTWNVSGLRSTLKKNFVRDMETVAPDVVCLQEIKAEQEQLRGPVLHRYSEHWNSSQAKKGYSGTLTLSRSPLSQVTLGFPEKVDVSHAPANEGRVITTGHDGFWLVNVYAPNAQERLKRLPERQAWNRALQAHVLELEKSNPVILCGDLNVAHKEIDLAHPQRNRGKSGFSDPERKDLDTLLAQGYCDAFRHFEKGPEHYTYWRFNKGTREKNLGWRIDYFVVSEKLMERVTRCFHLPDIMGSDHCPVVLEID